MIEIRSKVWLEKEGESIFGGGKALILKAIAEEGSISKAAKKMDISYRRAWSYIHAVEERIGRPMVIKIKGGRYGGGATLTDYAKDLLEKFEDVEQETRLFANRLFKEKFLKDGIV